ncbi:unnamed protein product [Sphenostylis stenocarpa]|uniref:Uncharacterized protein n=1 Tax=Sphenostylis stenocarpa TaxID=92480 RepID=A0AA86SNU6_9FABA|nr:unnamed protein product [Sphenostylis stenocarpa]
MGLPIRVTIIVICSLCIICNNGVEAFHSIYPGLQSISARSVSKLHRTAYHFQPRRNWINVDSAIMQAGLFSRAQSQSHASSSNLCFSAV